MHIMKKVEQGTAYYLSVENHYVLNEDAKGKEDAILFEMGQYNKKHEIDAVLTVSVKEAREFAEAILKQCDEIQN